MEISKEAELILQGYTNLRWEGNCKQKLGNRARESGTTLYRHLDENQNCPEKVTETRVISDIF